jgi:polyvinyl alcohol dehydrogenase (cytochrome)
MGPDFDIGNSPILVTLPNGKRPCSPAARTPTCTALDPDQNGKLLFHVNPLGATPGTFGRGGRGSMCGAAHGRTAGLLRHRRRRPVRINAEGGRSGSSRRQVWAGAVTPGWARRPRDPGRRVRRATDGQLFAVSAPTASSCGNSTRLSPSRPVNKVQARGGAINTSGAVVVDGMVFVGSGYAISAGASGGNVLLAFGVE